MTSDSNKGGNESGGDDSASDNDSDECLEEFLGGLSLGAVSEWKEEFADDGGGGGDQQQSRGCGQQPGPTSSSRGHGLVSSIHCRNKIPKQKQQRSDRNGIINQSNHDDNANYLLLFQNAHTIGQHGQIDRPPVNIQDFGTMKGHGLVASMLIPKGSTIYTERAAVAVQLPLQSPTSMGLSNCNTIHHHLQRQNRRRPRACQTCFRSLEGYTAALVSTATTMEDSENDRGNLNLSFPFPHLWPVQELHFNIDPKQTHVVDNNNKHVRTDSFGRILCDGCGSFFCSLPCYCRKIQDVGSCCTETTILKNLPIVLGSRNGDGKETDLTGNDDVDDKVVDDETGEVQAPVVLGTVLFLQLIVWHRDKVDKQDAWIFQVCGEADDIQLLELGNRHVCEKDNDDNGNKSNSNRVLSYTLLPLYNYLVDALKLTADEREFLSLELLHSLASKAARNGFGLRTQSPFQMYYQSLIRQSPYGGRQSDSHARHKAQLALALTGGSSDHFERGMDRQIDELVSPDVTALFSLTTQCNHSCRPNAQVQSGNFADALIDLVALQDIHPGDEIFISYIRLGHHHHHHTMMMNGHPPRRSTYQRRRELSAKYLFNCMCEECAA